ncbi:subtilisin-like serine-protease S [Nicotiana tabacum]|uniref:Subtilisin-like serine-protease S n=1 Tax=Nicotiana tabacum TaxID=4097 RepID=A0AC58S3X2_TOBAC
MKTLSILGLLFCIQLVSSFLATNGGVDHHKQYIVYMGKHSFLNEQSVIDSNHDILASVIGRGFSAMLTPKQAAEISRKESVAAVFESKTYYLQNTRSWDFLGAPANSIFGATAIQGDYEVIVGDIDSDISMLTYAIGDGN